MIHIVIASWWQVFAVKSIIIPIAVGTIIGAITYGLLRYYDEKRKRKDYSKLGVAIIGSFKEEVNTGMKIFNSVLSGKFATQKVPSASWININTISDEVLLRIICVSENVNPNGKYHPRDIRNLTKNYFEHTCPGWNYLIDKNIQNIQLKVNISQIDSDALTFKDFANDIIIMLDQTIDLLKRNSKARFPK
jgi:hypothetical protein